MKNIDSAGGSSEPQAFWGTAHAAPEPPAKAQPSALLNYNPGGCFGEARVTLRGLAPSPSGVLPLGWVPRCWAKCEGQPQPHKPGFGAGSPRCPLQMGFNPFIFFSSAFNRLLPERSRAAGGLAAGPLVHGGHRGVLVCVRGRSPPGTAPKPSSPQQVTLVQGPHPTATAQVKQLSGEGERG